MLFIFASLCFSVSSVVFILIEGGKMKAKLNISNMVRLGLILAIFAASVCIMLAFVYTGASRIIAQREEAGLQTALKEIFPDADNFKPAEGLISPDPSVRIGSAYIAEKDGLPIGMTLEAVRRGYEGPIRIMVGVGIDSIITGVKILDHSETPGLGANAASSKFFVDRVRGITFYGQFTGKNINDPFTVKDDVIAVTASTVTSVAVARAVKAAGIAAITRLIEVINEE